MSTTSDYWLRADFGGQIHLYKGEDAIENLGLVPTVLDIEAALHKHTEPDVEYVDADPGDDEPSDVSEPDTLAEARGEK